MFGKRPSSDALADRVRRIADAKAPSPASKPAAHRDPRQTLFRNGVVIIDDAERLNVVIKDLSDSGARVEFFVRRILPDAVTLAEPMLKLRRRARVVWQRDGVAGLAFV
jgi:hypothetical protein